MEPNDLIINGELVLYGFVGDDFFDDGFSAMAVVKALGQMRGDINVRLNSGGGFAEEGKAIYHALKSHDGKVTVHIDAMAASAASLIAMAGDEIICPKLATIMIHNGAALTRGTKEDHGKSIEMLGILDGQAAELYAERTGLSLDEITVMMTAETWMGGAEAVERGFATSTGEDADDDGAALMAVMPFDYSLYRNAPDRLAVMAHKRGWKAAEQAGPSAAIAHKEMTMSTKTAAAGKPAAKTDDTGNNAGAGAAAPEPTTMSADDINKTEMAAAKAERSRIQKITMAVKTAKLPEDFATDLIDKGVSVDTASTMILNKLAEDDEAEGISNKHRVTGGADQSERLVMGARSALLMKAGFDKEHGGERNEFSSMTLSEIARMSLERRGIVIPTNRLQMVGQAFMSSGMHSTSDFANVLADVANKAMLKGWDEAEETFQLWTSAGSASDFKPTKRVDANLFPALAEIAEGGEYSYGTIGDRGETVTIVTYGKMFSITRQAIINDDLGAFTRIPMKMGRAARRTVGNLAYAVLTSNPNMADGTALFHADHSNLAGSGAAPTVTTVDAARAAMAKQVDPDSHATGGLNIRPAHFLVPVELEGTARTLMASEFDPAKTQRTPNHVNGIAGVISDARLSTASATAWYMAADPASTDTVEITYLDGVQEPFMDQQDGWSVDGTEFKVRIDAAATPLDHRGLYKNAGA